MTEVHRIAVISDTHGVLRPEVEEVLKSCEIILHAGDMDDSKLYERLMRLGPIYAVRGNVDDWTEELPKELEKEFYGFRFYMLHNKAHTKRKLEGVDVVIFGHSHKYEEERREGILFLNPGSCGKRRFSWPLSMAVLTLYPAEHRIEAEKILIDDPTASKTSAAQKGRVPQLHKKDHPEDMNRLVRKIMRDVNAGRSVDEIAVRNQADRDLVEQICRMYVTHPGVDVDGILDRLALRAHK